MSERVKVLVTGVAGATIGEQVCKALRQGVNGYEFVICNSHAAGMQVIAADHYEIVPPAVDPSYLERLIEICERYAVQFVIPGSDPELWALAKSGHFPDRRGTRLLANSIAVIDICSNKSVTFTHLQEKGFLTPETFLVERVDALDLLPGRYPWVIKPPAGGSGSSNVFIAQDRQELELFTTYLLKSGYAALVQEYIGTVEDEYTVGVVHYPDGSLAGSIAIRRQISGGLSNRLKVPNRTGNLQLGSLLAISSGITQGEVGDFPLVRRRAEAVASALGSRGPLNIQGRWNGREFVPFEINPRFSGTEPLRAMVGFNAPEALINWFRSDGHQHPQMTATRSGIFTRGISDYFSAK